MDPIPLMSLWCNAGVPVLAAGHMTEPQTSEWSRPNAWLILWTVTYINDLEFFFLQNQVDDIPVTV